MTRKALIISNPGELGAENYCEGVKKDVANYKNFLMSAAGGGWDAQGRQKAAVRRIGAGFTGVKHLIRIAFGGVFYQYVCRFGGIQCRTASNRKY